MLMTSLIPFKLLAKFILLFERRNVVLVLVRVWKKEHQLCSRGGSLEIHLLQAQPDLWESVSKMLSGTCGYPSPPSVGSGQGQFGSEASLVPVAHWACRAAWCHLRGNNTSDMFAGLSGRGRRRPLSGTRTHNSRLSNVCQTVSF